MCVSETYRSCMFPCKKMHKQTSADCCRHIHPASDLHGHAKCCVRYIRVNTQTVIGVFFCACVSYSYMRMRSISRTYIVYTPTVSVKTKFSCYCPLKGVCQKIFTSIFYNSNLSRPLILKVFTNSVLPRYLITKLNNFNFTV